MAASYARRKALGDYGEELAALHLLASGYQVLDRNWRCPDGEVDIVATDGSRLVVCEVKTRSSGRFGTPLEAVTPEKSARLYRLGRSWAVEHLSRWSAIRVDVVCVVRLGDGTTRIEHLQGVC